LVTNIFFLVMKKTQPISRYS